MFLFHYPILLILSAKGHVHTGTRSPTLRLCIRVPGRWAHRGVAGIPGAIFTQDSLSTKHEVTAHHISTSQQIQTKWMPKTQLSLGQIPQMPMLLQHHLTEGSVQTWGRLE